jgi:hypothetical protein
MTLDAMEKLAELVEEFTINEALTAEPDPEDDDSGDWPDEVV